MTVPSATVRANSTGDGTAGPITFPFKIQDEAHLTVVVRDTTDGTDAGTTLVLNATNGYTVTGVGLAAGGSITLTGTYATSVTSDFKVTILHTPTKTQTTDTRNKSDWYEAKAGIEDSLDKLTNMSQSLQDQLDRSLTFSVSLDDAAPDALTNGELPVPSATAFPRRNSTNTGWEFVTTLASGTYTFPAVTVDNAHIRSDGTDGMSYQTSVLVEDDSGNFTGINSAALTEGLRDSNDNETIKTPATASAVNEITVTNAATGNAPDVSATGDDTNISLTIAAKGSGTVTVDGRVISTDGTKLDGIEASADVTDAANVATALSGATLAADLSIHDDHFKIVDNGDVTKIAQFQASGITTATTRTKTLQDTDGTLAELGDLQFTASYASSGQTITAAGLLTLAHSLGAVPKLITFYLQCTTTDAGFAVGDKIRVSLNGCDAATNRASVIYSDATNVYFRMSSTSTSFLSSNKSTGNVAALVNASWDIYVEAFA